MSERETFEKIITRGVVQTRRGRLQEAVGLLGPIRDAYLHEEIGAWMLRLVFGVTTVALIFGLALLVGFGMWVAMQVQRRRGAAKGA